MDFIKKHRKNIILGAIALLLALFLGVFAGVTFARFRSEYTGTDGARSARGIAEYSRGEMKLGGMPYTYAVNGDTLLCDNLSPGDELMYNYKINNNRTEEGKTLTNEVYLFIRCDFTFRVAAMDTQGKIIEEYLSMTTRGNREIGAVHYVIGADGTAAQILYDKDAVNVPANSGTTGWTAMETETTNANGTAVYTQSFGFHFMPSAQAESVSLSFAITLPDQFVTGNEVESLRLYADIDITAEQLIG
ncbi:MAG: hypothetical protein DBX59_08630 [Bacillota bacterium]|nr:MAG: hypothetical protein DBX59_08630 [Bacillota bacterium]